VIAAALPMGQTCIAEFDRLIGFEPFLAGSSLSIADLVLAPPLDFLMATPEGRALIEGTRLEDWLKRMNSRPSMLATQRPEVLRQTG
jgi:glutathione S-transferase